jgi:hypothetical protein
MKLAEVYFESLEAPQRFFLHQGSELMPLPSSGLLPALRAARVDARNPRRYYEAGPSVLNLRFITRIDFVDPASYEVAT